MSKKDKSKEIAPAPIPSFDPTTDSRPKREIIRECIEAGGATRQSLMEAANVNKAGLASQLSYLNLIALGAKTGFPMQDENGVFYMGTMEEYKAKQASRAANGRGPSVPKTPEQMLALARKREDRASSKLTNCKKRLETEATEENTLRYNIAELELRLASVLLGRVENGDFTENTESSDGPVEGSGENDADML